MTAYVSAHMVNVHMKATASGKSATAADARRGLLHEGARSLVDEWEQKWADKNPNIRTDEAHRNVVLVQAPGDDGSYDLREATTKQEADAFIKYGNERTALLEHPPRAGYTAFSSMAFHYPKEFCDEYAGEAQAVDKDGKKIFDKNGEPVMVARYTPKDYDEMRRYFDDALDLLSDQLGGREHVHGVFIHLDERTPHMQVVFDSYQPSDNEPDKLKAGHSLLWGTHEDVCYPKGTMIRGKDMSGKRISGARKMSEFQKDLREHMAECGWDVSVKRSARHKDHYTKDEYAEIDNARIAMEQESATLDKKRDDYESDVADYEVSLSALDDREDKVQEREDELDERERKLAEREKKIAAQEQANRQFIAMQIAWMQKQKENADDYSETTVNNTLETANQMLIDAENKRDEVYDAARKKAHKDVVTSLNKQISAAKQTKKNADQYSKQRRKDADTYYTSRTSSVAGDVETLRGEKATLEEDNRTLRENKASLTRQKNTLIDDVEKLERRKKRASIGDLVAEPDKLPGAIKTVSTVVNSNIFALRQAGMKQADLSTLQSALGLMQSDSRFQALANENEEKQGVRSALRDAGFGRQL